MKVFDGFQFILKCLIGVRHQRGCHYSKEGLSVVKHIENRFSQGLQNLTDPFSVAAEVIAEFLVGIRGIVLHLVPQILHLQHPCVPVTFLAVPVPILDDEVSDE